MGKSFTPADLERCHAQFEEEGYLVLPGFFAPEEIDSVLAATDSALQSRAMEIVVDSLVKDERTFYGLAPNPESLNFKFNDLYLFLDEIRQLGLDPELTSLLRTLLGGLRPMLCNTLTLLKGSSQPIHIDSLFMTPQTPHHLIASWMAFEDVDPTAGPLVYYPRSHHILLYRFRDGSHHATNADMPEWTAYIEREVKERGLEKKTFLARKGDVFLWHSDLVHGGGPIQDPHKTRRSLICHYFTEPDARKMPDWQLEPLNGGFWFNRLPPAARPAPERFDDMHPFPEEAYLRRNPDLQTALADGRIESGFEHYRTHGYAEGRQI